MSLITRVIVAFLLSAYIAAAWSYTWNKDMVDQPSAKPQESEAPPAPGSVPTRGTEIVPAPATQQGMYDAKDAAVSIPNPVPATADSIARGKYFYEINCLVCHGNDGLCNGPVGQKFATSPADLNDPYTQDQADGQLFFTITRGRDAMPFYRDALSQQERWDVVNYIRTEFGPK